MPLDLWLAFVIASAVLLVIPGPVVTLLVATGLGQGRAAAVAMIPGVVLGDLVAMCLSMAGVGPLLLASAALFAAVKWLGAAYLVWLGVRMWRQAPHLPPAIPPAIDARSLGTRAFLVNVLNPKSILFFVAFMPQFVVPGRAALPQLMLLGGTFLGLSLLSNLAWALAAGSGGQVLGSHLRRVLHRCGAGALVGAGLLTAGLRRA